MRRTGDIAALALLFSVSVSVSRYSTAQKPAPSKPDNATSASQSTVVVATTKKKNTKKPEVVQHKLNVPSATAISPAEAEIKAIQQNLDNLQAACYINCPSQVWDQIDKAKRQIENIDASSPNTATNLNGNDDGSSTPVTTDPEAGSDDSVKKVQQKIPNPPIVPGTNNAASTKQDGFDWLRNLPKIPSWPISSLALALSLVAVIVLLRDPLKELPTEQDRNETREKLKKLVDKIDSQYGKSPSEEMLDKAAQGSHGGISNRAVAGTRSPAPEQPPKSQPDVLRPNAQANAPQLNESDSAPTQEAPSAPPTPPPDPNKPSGDPLKDYNHAHSMGGQAGEEWFYANYPGIGLSCVNQDDRRLDPAATLFFEPSARGVFLAVERGGQALTFPAIKRDFMASQGSLDGVFLYPPGAVALRLIRPAVLQRRGEQWELMQPGEFGNA
jgi:hypothetical protein